MKRTHALLLGVVLILAASDTPQAAPNREHQQLMADIRMLQEQNQQLQQLLGGLTDALKVVSAKLDEQAATAKKTMADQKLLVDNVAGDVRIVRERLNDTNVRLSSLSQEIEAIRQSMPRYPSPSYPPAETGMPPASGQATDPAAAPPPLAVAPPPSAAGLSPQRMFDEAKADYAVGQFTLAVSGFDTFLKTFPRSELAPDAQYYIGETMYIERKFQDAVAAYTSVIQNYPNSNQVPNAYYKRGNSLIQLANDRGTAEADRARLTKEAMESWQFVVKNFPDSDGSRLAQQALAQDRRPR